MTRTTPAALLAISTLLISGLPALTARADLPADLPGESFKNHLVISLGFGGDFISPKDYDTYTNAFEANVHSPTGQLNPNVAIRAAVLATYYAPYYALVRTGIAPDFFFPNGKVAGDQVTNYGGMLEVPLMVGGHYALLGDRLILELALGPCLAGFTSAGLNGSNGNKDYQQVYATPSFGFDSEIKGQFFVTHGFSLGLELGYRVLSSNTLHESGQSGYYQPPFPPYSTTTGNHPIHLDLSGFRVELELGFLAF